MIIQTVSRSLAELARDVGFKEDTLFGLTPYGNMTSKLSIPTGGTMPYVKWKKHDSDLRLPTYFELSKWLREEHEIYLFIHRHSTGSDEWEFSYSVQYLPKQYHNLKRRSTKFKYIEDTYIEYPGGYTGCWYTYEEALEAGLKYCLSWIK